MRVNKTFKYSASLLFLLLILIFTLSCGNDNANDNNAEASKSETRSDTEAVYMNITSQEAKKIMDSEKDYAILDVRTEEEYAEGHIPGAILIPNTEIRSRAEELLPDKDRLILVYCRSGRRSKLASEELVSLGYTNIKEFGGIIDWQYETEK